MQLDLSDDEATALVKELDAIIERRPRRGCKVS